MNRETWKSIERFWARKLGGERIPVTGRHSGDVPDIDHPLWAIEVKAGKTLNTRLREGMKQAIRASTGTNKTPLLCITHNLQGRDGSEHWVAMRLQDWVEWHGPTEMSEKEPGSQLINKPGNSD